MGDAGNMGAAAAVDTPFFTPSTFFIYRIGSTYYVRDFDGTLVNSGSNFRTVGQWAIDNVPIDTNSNISGGAIILAPNTTFDLGNPTGDGLILEENKTKHIDFLGSGFSTVLRYTGTGNMIHVQNTLAASSFIQYRLGNFSMIGISGNMDQGGLTVPSGRDGIYVDATGGRCEIFNIWGRSFDNILTTYCIEFAHIHDIVAKIFNNGIKLIGNIAVQTCSGNNIHDFDLQGAFDHCIWYNSTGSAFETAYMHHGTMGKFKHGITVESWGMDVNIHDLYTEGFRGLDEADYGTESLDHIEIKGTASYPMERVTLRNMHLGAVENCDYAIIVNHVKQLELDKINAKGFRQAMVLINSNSDNLDMIIKHPGLRAYGATGEFSGTATPYLIDTPSDSFLTTSLARLAGKVETSRAIGQIMVCSSTGLAEGDVVTVSPSSGQFVFTTTTVDNLRPAVVMYPNKGAGRPIVIATNGIRQVNMDGATTYGDTITTSATAKKGRVNNNAVDPKIILGYSTSNIGSAGLAYAQIK